MCVQNRNRNAAKAAGAEWQVALSVFWLCVFGANLWAQTTASDQVNVQGDGAQHLLLIPCAGCDRHSWETFMERNRQRYTMHDVTLPFANK